MLKAYECAFGSEVAKTVERMQGTSHLSYMRNRYFSLNAILAHCGGGLPVIVILRRNLDFGLILKTYLAGMYLAFLLQFWLLHFQKHTHMLMPIFEIFLHSGP